MSDHNKHRYDKNSKSNNASTSDKCQQETNNYCRNDHFSNPQEDDIPPYAPSHVRHENTSQAPLQMQDAKSSTISTTVSQNTIGKNASDLPILTEDYMSMQFIESVSPAPSVAQGLQTNNVEATPALDQPVAANENAKNISDTQAPVNSVDNSSHGKPQNDLSKPTAPVEKSVQPQTVDKISESPVQSKSLKDDKKPVGTDIKPSEPINQKKASDGINSPSKAPPIPGAANEDKKDVSEAPKPQNDLSSKQTPPVEKGAQTQSINKISKPPIQPKSSKDDKKPVGTDVKPSEQINQKKASDGINGSSKAPPIPVAANEDKKDISEAPKPQNDLSSKQTPPLEKGAQTQTIDKKISKAPVQPKSSKDDKNPAEKTDVKPTDSTTEENQQKQASDGISDPSKATPRQKPSKHAQVPDDYYDRPIIADQKLEEEDIISDPNAKPAPTPSEHKHTQAPDDIDDPPIITEQASTPQGTETVPISDPSDMPKPSAAQQETEKVAIVFNPNIMPAWAEEFIATRCGKTPCCETEKKYDGDGIPGNSYCQELLNKYRNPPASQQPGQKDANNNQKPGPTPSKASQVHPTKSNQTTVAPNPKKEDETPGYCKTWCCCSWCCTYDSWMIWLILLVPLLLLLYMIWWKQCGTAVLVLKDASDWPNFPFTTIRDLKRAKKDMKLFLSSLGYFAYFILIGLCYTCCKTCALPKDPKGWCSCKEYKLVIHLVYGTVLILFLRVAVWKDDKRKRGANRVEHHVLDCLELCFWFSGVLFFLGVIVFVIYSLERRKIRKRIAPAPPSEENPVDNRPNNNVPKNLANNKANVPAQALLHSICTERARPIFQPPRTTHSKYDFCQERFKTVRDMYSPCGQWRSKLNEPCSC